jgi:predicted AlkP superfamily pyrophosphatase or phosphodiesterase
VIARRLYFVLPILVATLSAAPPDTSHVLLFSLDGMGYQRWTEDPISEELSALRGIATIGATAEGVQPHFPSTTANSHAALWTGAYGDVNGISANSNPAVPRKDHLFTDRVVGFRADSLIAEPIWAAAARQGVTAVAYQATQAYPFLPVNTAPGARTPPVVVNGYQTKMVTPWAMVRRSDVKPEDCAAWKPPLSSPRCYTWTNGPFTLHVAKTREEMLISADPAGPRVAVRAAVEDTEAPRHRPLARHFSAGLFVAPELVVHFRLYSVSSDDFLLLVTPIHELGVFTGDSKAMLRDTGAFVGNGPLRLFESAQLGATVPNGGDGIAERRFLEATEFVVRQNVRQTEWLWRRYSPRLLTGYLNYPDEIDHLMLGLTHPEVPDVTPAVRASYQGFRRWGYVILNRALESFVALKGKRDHIIFTSDHGMAPVWKHVRVNEVLRQAGLGDIAVHVYNFLVLNTEDWKGGSIPVAQRELYADKAQAALGAVKDPDTGDAVFRSFARPSQDGARYGIGGPSGGDLYWDLAPGYYFSNASDGPILSTLRTPAGNHGFLPTRPDMLAICIAAGPRIAKHSRWPRLRGTDIAPLTADLLGIQPPAQSRGRSPLQ